MLDPHIDLPEDGFRWETPDGESPSQFGFLNAVPWVLLIYATVGFAWWARTWPL